MAEINYFKIRIKRGVGSPGTTLDVGEIGYDTSNNKLYIGNNIGENPNGLTMDASFNPAIARLDDYNAIQDASILAFELNDVSFDYVDGSIVAAVNAVDTSLVTYIDNNIIEIDTSLNAVDLRINDVDSSLDLYETKVNLDTSFGLYSITANLDISLNSINVRIDNVDSSLDLYETKTNLDTSFGLYETETNLDSSLGVIWTELDALDASLIAFEENDVTFDYVDGSISTAVDYIDTSLNAVDLRINDVDSSLDLYETKTNLDSSFGVIDLRIDNVDASFGLYETKLNINSSLNVIDLRIDNVDTSFGLYEKKTNIDSSFGSISIDDLDDVSVGTTLADEDLLQYKVDTSTWDNVEVEDATDYFELKTNIDSSFGDYETKVNLDTSFGLYLNLISDNSISGVTEFDASIIIRAFNDVSTYWLDVDITGALVANIIS